MAKSKYTNIGGQALLEGVMMRGSVHTAMAVRNTAGDIEIEMYPTVRKERPAICKKPFIRGIFGLIDSLSIGYKCLMRSADLSGMAEEEAVSYTHLTLPTILLVPAWPRRTRLKRKPAAPRNRSGR